MQGTGRNGKFRDLDEEQCNSENTGGRVEETGAKDLGRIAFARKVSPFPRDRAHHVDRNPGLPDGLTSSPPLPQGTLH